VANDGASVHDPFGFGIYQQNPNSSLSSAPQDSERPPNPMLMDGYRNILEHLLGGIGQAGFRPPNEDYVPLQGQGQPSAPPPNGNRPPPFQGPTRTLGGNAPPPQAPPPQPQTPPRPTRRFQYSITTYGPRGVVHHISSNSDSSMPEGEQIVIPTLDEFLGMHGQQDYPAPPLPNGGTRIYANSPLGTMLRHLMENVTPLHGNPGDYLQYVAIHSKEGI
jgi:hypothetical protein